MSSPLLEGAQRPLGYCSLKRRQSEFETCRLGPGSLLWLAAVAMSVFRLSTTAVANPDGDERGMWRAPVTFSLYGCGQVAGLFRYSVPAKENCQASRNTENTRNPDVVHGSLEQRENRDSTNILNFIFHKSFIAIIADSEAGPSSWQDDGLSQRLAYNRLQ
jgi:hypothetical protein